MISSLCSIPAACVIAVAIAQAQCAVAGARTAEQEVETVSGVIRSAAPELIVLDSGAAPSAFRIDDSATYVFRGIRMLKAADLKPGMRVEIDYYRGAGDELPRARWIEVLPVENASAAGMGAAR